MRKLRVLVLLHRDLLPPASLDGMSDDEIQSAPWKMEFDVVTSLEEMGHQVRTLGVVGDLVKIREAIEDWKPHVAFNLLEEFDGVSAYDQNIVGFLELLHQPYTGCNPRGLLLARDKALSKKIMAYHRIRVPAFGVFPLGRAVRRPRRLEFPLFVKSLTEEASLGIAQASIVHDDEKLAERVAFIHRQLETDAIAEEYIEGRELYVGVIGNKRLQTFPIWEMLFTKVPDDMPRIATGKVKWDLAYQKRWGIDTRAAEDIAPEIEKKIVRVCKRAYRILGMSGYGRMDLRMAPDGRVYVLEANPNPQIGYGEDFAESAESAGVSYESFVQRILNLGMRYHAEWKRWL